MMITKKFGTYQLIACTAIAVSAGDVTEDDCQEAILVRKLDACAGDADSILFGGYRIDEMDEEAFLDVCANDPFAISIDEDDLETVLIDGKPISAYVSGEL